MITNCAFCDTEILDLNASHYHKLDGHHLYLHPKCWIKVLSLLNLVSKIVCEEAIEQEEVKSKSGYSTLEII